MGRFHYYEPASVAEARELSLRLGGDAAFVAGGTDVVARMNKGRAAYQHIINIKKLAELSFIRLDGACLRVGATTKLTALLADETVKNRLPSLYAGVASIGSPHIRNLGTLGGNICNASPCADSVPPLICLGAGVVLTGKDGEREMALAEFLLGPGKTALAPGELLREVVIPLPGEQARHCFLKMGPRKTADIAVVNVAAALTLENGVCRAPRIALGSVAPTVIRAPGAEALLDGKKPGDIDCAAVGRAAAQDARPISDLRASLEYRREIVAVYVERAVGSLLA